MIDAPILGPELAVRTWVGNRLIGDGFCIVTDVGVGGACAICAMPFGVRSIERSVVGFVLADMLLNVLGSLKYDDDERDGLGEGGDVGGSGRMDASSSASTGFDREPQSETAAPLDRLVLSTSRSSSSPE